VAADDAVLNNVHKKKKSKKIPPLEKILIGVQDVQLPL
jgi:hypothetical protein